LVDAGPSPVADAGAPDAGDVPDPSAFQEWRRFFDVGDAAEITERVVASDGTTYLAVEATGRVQWGSALVEGPSTLILELDPGGEERWARVVPAGTGRLAVDEGTLYAWHDHTLVARDRRDGRDRWTHTVTDGASLRATPGPDAIWIHGDLPLVERLDAAGTPSGRWSNPPIAPVLFPTTDGGAITVGDGKVTRFTAAGEVAWTQAGWKTFGTSARAGEDVVFQATLADDRVVLARLDGSSGNPRWLRPLPAAFWGGGLVAAPAGGDVFLAGELGEGFDFDGELRAPIGAGQTPSEGEPTRWVDQAIVWLDASGKKRAVWAFGDWRSDDGRARLFATQDALYVTGDLSGTLPWSGTSFDTGFGALPPPGPMPAAAPYGLAVSWSRLEAALLPRCFDKFEVLERTPLDLHVVFDLSREGSAPVDGSPSNLRQLAGDGIAPLFASLGHDRVSFLTPPLAPPPRPPLDGAPWPVVAEANRLDGGKLTLALDVAPPDLDPAVGPALVQMVRGAAAITVDHLRGAVRQGVVVVIAPTAAAKSWTDADLAVVTGARKTRPFLPTHVIGLGRPSADLDELAVAGGTKARYLEANPFLGFAVAMAIDDIRQEYRCSYTTLPRAIKMIEAAQFYVALWHTSGALFRVDRVEECRAGEDGWVLDQTGSSKTIRFCEVTCGRIDRDWRPAADDIQTGCSN
jgi:hypothetical protein